MPEPTPVSGVAVMACEICGALDPGPRDLCPKCHGPLKPNMVGGSGVLISWTLIRRPPASFREEGPYAVAVVQLDAGVQVTGRLDNPDERVGPGARVSAVARHRDTTIFRLA